MFSNIHSWCNKQATLSDWSQNIHGISVKIQWIYQMINNKNIFFFFWGGGGGGGCENSWIDLWWKDWKIFYWWVIFSLRLIQTLISTLYTVKPVLSSHSKIDKTKTLMTNGSLMKVKSIAEFSPWSILQYFWPALSNNQPLKNRQNKDLNDKW